MKEVKEQILALRKALHDHNYRYYVLDDPIISDYEFDQRFTGTRYFRKAISRIS